MQVRAFYTVRRAAVIAGVRASFPPGSLRSVSLFSALNQYLRERAFGELDTALLCVSVFEKEGFAAGVATPYFVCAEAGKQVTLRFCRC